MDEKKCSWPSCRREAIEQCVCRNHVCTVHDGRVSVGYIDKHYILGGWCPQCRWSAK